MCSSRHGPGTPTIPLVGQKHLDLLTSKRHQGRVLASVTTVGANVDVDSNVVARLSSSMRLVVSIRVSIRVVTRLRMPLGLPTSSTGQLVLGIKTPLSLALDLQLQTFNLTVMRQLQPLLLPFEKVQLSRSKRLGGIGRLVKTLTLLKSLQRSTTLGENSL
jgi:hypothetical protein